MIILAIASVGLLSGGAYAINAAFDNYYARVRHADLIRRGYIL